MKTPKFKKLDKVVSISDEGELERYKIYTVLHIYITSDSETNEFDYNLDLKDLMWVYHIKNFITMSEYRSLKLRNIENKYERR